VVKPLREHLVGAVSTPLWILLGDGRHRVPDRVRQRGQPVHRARGNPAPDLAVRSALGAGRGDLVRSQVTEALLLAAAGGATGALIAWAGVPLLVRAAPEAVAGGFGGAPIPGLATAGLDVTALLFTVGISVLAACAFGLLPALRFSGSRLGSVHQAGRGIVGGNFTRDALVSCRPPPRSSCWWERRCSCAASGSSATSTQDTTPRTSSRSRLRPIAPT
jgi:putative ABC transport system permease protein